MPKILTRTWLLTGAALFVGAFFWTAAVARRGFFVLDQSIVLDGAWRMHTGQTPYVDFITPNGLPLFWLQARVFEAVGVSFDATLLLGALLGGVAAVLAFTISAFLYQRLGLALVAGFLTALWLQAPHGTPFPDQAAFVCTLAALAHAVPAVVGASRRDRVHTQSQ